MQKNILIITVCLMLSVSTSFGASKVKADSLSADAEAAVLIECNQNKVLYAKNAHTSLPMASTTKIMTALVALEYFEPNELITVSKDSVGIEGTSAYLEEGETFTLEELLYALLLQSANDAAAAIAIGVAGSVDNFSVLMNRKSTELGLSGTSFQNPHGLPCEGHYTTAYDLAIIASNAMKNECIKKITSTKSIGITSEQGKTRYFSNHNKMLLTYKGADGVKTGFTKASGRCLVSSACQNDLRLIAVTLNCRGDWAAHTSMLDYGFSNYRSVSLSSVSETERFIPCVSDGGVIALRAEDCFITVKAGDEDKLRVTYEHPRFVYHRPKCSYIGQYTVTLYKDLVHNGKIAVIN